MVALFSGVLLTLVLVVLHAGRLSVAKQELTSFADAAALAGAAVLREKGSQGNDLLDLGAHVSLLREENTRLPAQVQVSVVRDPENDDRVWVRADVTGDYTNPYALLGQRAFRIRASSQAVLNEWGRDKRWPIMVLMVDASASMGQRVGEGFNWRFWENPPDKPTYYDLLSRLIEDYVALPFPVRNGLVVFGSDILQTVEPPAQNVNNLAEIKAALANVSPTSNCTNYAKALNRAAQMVEARGDAVILITDGQPTCGGTFEKLPIFGSPFWEDHHEAAYTAGEALRGAGGVYTIETRGREARDFLLGMSGGGGDPDGGDANYYYGVSNLEDIAAFRAAMARITCMFGTLPETTADDWCDKNRIGVFFRDPDGEEEQLERIDVAEVDTSTNDYGFACRQTDGGAVVQLAPPACYQLARFTQRELWVRWGGARLSCRPESRSLVDCLEQ